MDLEDSTVIGGNHLTVCEGGGGGVCGVCGGVEMWWEGVEFIKGMHGAAHQKDLLHKLSLHLVYIQFGAVQLGEERGEGGDGASQLFMDLEG